MSEDISCPKCGTWIKYWQIRYCQNCIIQSLTQELEEAKNIIKTFYGIKFKNWCMAPEFEKQVSSWLANHDKERGE